VSRSKINPSDADPPTGDSAARRSLALRIVTELRGRGHAAYFAGGCVRDELLSIAPSDYDVATDATPQAITSIFKGRTSEVGASFGVVLVRDHGLSVEVATFRADGPYSDRRRPDHVHFSDPASDAQRRDFTINAMFLDPLAAVDAQIIDFVGGRADLAARVVRAVGDADARLSEDHLRALRAVRFAARLGFSIEPATADAIRRHASELSGVSRERIGDELRRMLAHPSRGMACRLMNDLSLDAAAFDLPPMQVAPDLVSRLVADADAMIALAAWLLDRGRSIGPDELGIALDTARHCRRSLCLSNDETASLVGTLQTLDRIVREWDALDAAGDVARLKRLAARAHFPRALTLLSLVNQSKNEQINNRVGILTDDGIGLSPDPLLSGDDLIAAGLVPGPKFRSLLDLVYDAQLRGDASTIPTALAIARELAIRLGV